MLQQTRSPTITIPSIQTLTNRPSQHYNPDSPIFRRRKTSKFTPLHRTPQQMIIDFHSQLLQSIDSLDEKMQKVVGTYQAGFLEAYRSHITKLRSEMEEIRQRTLHTAQNEKNYTDKIESLFRELTIFRQESLKLSQTLIRKDEEIQSLKIKLKELVKEQAFMERKIVDLTRKNKEMGVTIQRYGTTEEENKCQKQDQSNRNSKNYAMRVNIGQCDWYRPCTTTLNSKTQSLSVRNASVKKQDSCEKEGKNHIISEKLDDSVSLKMDQIFNTMSQKNQQERKNQALFYPQRKNFRMKLQKGNITHRTIEREVERMRSKDFVVKNQNQKLFMTCVQQVKKQIIRKQNVPSLNYFKQNGPKNIVQFKRMDYLSLLTLLVSHQNITTKLYEFIFNSP